jgi:hypothetical protein
MKRRFRERGEKRFWRKVAVRQKHDYDSHERWSWMALCPREEAQAHGMKDPRSRMVVGHYRARGVPVQFWDGVKEPQRSIIPGEP